jgi:deoxyribodipyrimidine photo-lyase
VTPAGGDHFKVFTPYLRAWSEVPPRRRHGAPRRLRVPSGLPAGRLPALDALLRGSPSPARAKGGEREGRRAMRAFLREGIGEYGERHDDLPGDATSRLSAYLRFGCVSALELVREASERRGGEPFVRQLCWRDFHHQVLAANPSLPRRDYRPRGDRWSRSRRALEAWREGLTGYPIVDAAMRQLAEEGFMHNRARMTVASFLTKDLYLDWREGAAHFWDLLSDGEIANNAGNWQWVAGTGNDTRPNRVLNPLRQAERFDPDGEYVRRYLPELEGIEGGAVHRPWTLEGFSRIDYPAPIVDHDEAAAAFRARRED